MMHDDYTQLRFVAANYSKLQGLREVPIGLFIALSAAWTMYRPGNMTVPSLLILGTILLYSRIDHFYADTFGRIRPTSRMRVWEVTVSILFGLLAMLAFALDTAQDLSFSALGLVFATAMLLDFWRTTRSVRNGWLRLYPENFIAACLILILSLLPLTGPAWWERMGLQSRVLSMLIIIGILITMTGIWGHLRMLRILPIREAQPDDHTV